MPTVVVILPTQTYRATDFVKAAQQLGVDLIVASEAAPPMDMGDGYLEIDCLDPQAAANAIVALGDQASIDGVVAADDAGVVVAALAGEALGLLSNKPDAAGAARNKQMQRELLARAEVPQPPFAILTEHSQPEQAAETVGYPLVVKPVDRSAGQGVIRVDSPEELLPTIARVENILKSVGASTDTLLVESFLNGVEVAVEGIIGPNGLTALAVFDKPSPISGPGFQETMLVTPSRQSEETQSECIRVAAAAVAALGLTHGPVHIELMISGTKVSVIEIAARSIGGLCSRSLSFGLMDTTLESLILRNALGRDKPELRRDNSASGVLMIPIPRAGTLKTITGLDHVDHIDGVTGFDITARPGDQLAPPPEGSRYLGFVFARAEAASDVETALTEASSRIRVTIQ